MNIPKKIGNASDMAEENSAIIGMMRLLMNAGKENFNLNNSWEKCLCAIIVSLNPKITVRQFLESLPYNNKVFDEADALNTIAHLGYFARNIKVNSPKIDTRLMPCLFIPDKGSPYIILGQDKNGITKFCDSNTLMIISSPPQNSSTSGRAWIFEKYDENRPSLSKFMRLGSGKSWFRALIDRFQGTFIQIMFCGFALNIIALVIPLFIMLTYDRVIAAGTLDPLPILAAGAFMAVVFEAILRHIRSRGLSWLAGRLDNIVGNKILAHLLNLPPSLIETASVSSQLARIKTFESVRDFFSGSVFLSLLELPFVFLSLIVIIAIAGWLAMVPIAMIALYFITFTVIRSKIKIAIRLAAKASSARQLFSIETFEKLDSIRSSGLSEKWLEKFRNCSGREMFSHFYLNFLGMLAETIAHAITVIAAITTISFGAHLIWSGSITTGALVATMMLVWRVLTPFYSLCTMIPRLEQIRNSIIQVNALMEHESEQKQSRPSGRLLKIKGNLNFDAVTFQYAADMPNVITDLTFSAENGKIIAITGQNGSGKSTILKLAKGLYMQNSGSISIDGFDLRQLQTSELRRQISYIPQHAEIFNGEVIENIRITNPLATEKEIKEALILADAYDEICNLPQGLYTKIGRSSHVIGSTLRTKISLARAYVHNTSIMLIDELPNTLLSSNAGKNLLQYVQEKKQTMSLIIVTYREDFMQLADNIIVLRKNSTATAGNKNYILEHLKNEGAA